MYVWSSKSHPGVVSAFTIKLSIDTLDTSIMNIIEKTAIFRSDI